MTTGQYKAAKLLKIALFTMWGVLFLVGVAALFDRLTTGLRLTAMTSYVVWGLWISTDIYFIGLSAGAFLISSLVYVFQVKALERVGKFALFTALITLILAILSAWFDIGHLERFYEIFTRPNFHSILNDVVWLYSAYFLLLLTELWLALRPDLLKLSQLNGVRGRLSRLLIFGQINISAETLGRDRKLLRVLGGVGVPLAITFHGGMGVLFATLIARPYWYGPLYPIYFLAGALASGTALLTALTAFFWPKKDRGMSETVASLGRILLGLILFDLLLEFADLSIPAWYGVGAEISLLETVLFGQFWYVFWIFHMLLGVVVPLALLISMPYRTRTLGISGALVAITFMAVRLNIVIPGLVTPELPGLNSAYVDSRLSFTYFPSLFEWQLVLLIVTLGIGLFYLGYSLLPLFSAEDVMPR